MSNRLEQLLSFWHPLKDEHEWVLATIIETAGSSYRKSGAMMFINSLGQYQGIISGGCLESDLMRQARKCLQSGKNLIVSYDTREDDDIEWQLDLGCGGMVKALLQPVNKSNQYLQLEKLKSLLKQRKPCFYYQDLSSDLPKNHLDHNACTHLSNLDTIIEHIIKPTPLLAIIGGGIDAQPVCDIAHTLGWQTVIIDERVNFAQPKWFPRAHKIINLRLEQASDIDWFYQLDAIVIMTHNIKLDSKAILLAQKSNAQFVGLLGPRHRTQKVLDAAGLSLEDLNYPLSNPIGLNIGGELPESIALSILSEVHAVLEKN